MLKKHTILIGILFALLLLVIATLYYPGGSQYDLHSTGFNWRHNYFSNLFNPKAVNGMDNLSQPWAVAGMFMLCFSFALFFNGFSKNIPKKSAAIIIRFFGVGAMVSGFLIATPLHDIMVTISGTMALVSIFYITVYIFKSKLLVSKFLCVFCLLIFYTCNFLYYTSSYLFILPVMQKVLFLSIITWVLVLHYFTNAEDFKHIS